MSSVYFNHVFFGHQILVADVVRVCKAIVDRQLCISCNFVSIDKFYQCDTKWKRPTKIVISAQRFKEPRFDPKTGKPVTPAIVDQPEQIFWAYDKYITHDWAVALYWYFGGDEYDDGSDILLPTIEYAGQAGLPHTIDWIESSAVVWFLEWLLKDVRGVYIFKAHDDSGAIGEMVYITSKRCFLMDWSDSYPEDHINKASPPKPADLKKLQHAARLVEANNIRVGALKIVSLSYTL